MTAAQPMSAPPPSPAPPVAENPAPSAPAGQTFWRLKPGDECGPYEIVRRIGEGGYAIVYQAVDINSGEQVALKVVVTRFVEDKLATQRLLREAVELRGLNHVNVVGYRHAGRLPNGEGFWLAMELVRGKTLRQLFSEGRVPVRRMLEIGSQLCAGLGALHEVPLVHRDIKPQNVMLTADGTVKIIDLGIVRTREGAGTTTQVGSPMYCAPDYLRHSASTLRTFVDTRWDLFSAGVVLWEGLGGHHPFLPPGTDDMSLGGYLAKFFREGGVPRLPKPLPDTIGDVVAKAVEMNPDNRWQTAAELAAALNECAQQYLPVPELVAPPLVVHSGTAPLRVVADPLAPSGDELLAASGTRPLSAAELAAFRDESPLPATTAPLPRPAAQPLVPKRTAPMDVIRAMAEAMDPVVTGRLPVDSVADLEKPEAEVTESAVARVSERKPLLRRTVTQRQYNISMAVLGIIGFAAALAIILRLLGVV